MTTIYCIEDINDLKYVGSTTRKLYNRLANHRYDEKRGHHCSSSKLNLYNCIIYPLETCSESERLEREKYWIHKIDCVNERKFNFDQKEYRENNPGKIKETKRNAYIKSVVKSVMNDLITQIENASE